MTILQCIVYCLNQFQIWSDSDQPNIDPEIELRHDGLEHGLVFFFTGLMVDPESDTTSERSELATLLVGDALLRGETKVKIEGVVYYIPPKWMKLSKKISYNYSEIRKISAKEALTLLLQE